MKINKLFLSICFAVAIISLASCTKTKTEAEKKAEFKETVFKALSNDECIKLRNQMFDKFLKMAYSIDEKKSSLEKKVYLESQDGALVSIEWKGEITITRNAKNETCDYRLVRFIHAQDDSQLKQYVWNDSELNNFAFDYLGIKNKVNGKMIFGIEDGAPIDLIAKAKKEAEETMVEEELKQIDKAEISELLRKGWHYENSRSPIGGKYEQINNLRLDDIKGSVLYVTYELSCKYDGNYKTTTHSAKLKKDDNGKWYVVELAF